MDESGTTDQPSQIETKIKQLIEDSQKDIGEGGALKTQVAYLEEGLEKNIGNSVSRVTQFEKEVIHDERRAKKEIIHQSSLCKSVIISNLKNIKKIYLLFQNSLVILGIAFFFLIIAYGLYISGFVPGQYFIFGFSIIFVIFIIYLIKILKCQRMIDINEINELESSIKDINYSHVDPPQINVEEIFKPDLLNPFKNALGTIILRCSEELIPLVNQFYKFSRDKANWDITCEEIKKALIFFKIENVEKAFKSTQIPSVFAEVADNERIREKEIIKAIHGKVKIENATINSEIIDLFYNYYKGNNTVVEWEKIKEDNQQLTTVSKIIFKSKNVDFDLSEVTEDAFFEILKRTSKFNLNTIFNECLLFQKIHEYLGNYHQELFENHVRLNGYYNEKDIILRINFHEDFKNNFISIFSSELKENLNTPNPERYVNPLLAILLNSDLSLKKIVCNNASDNESVLILMSYLDLLTLKRENNEEFKLNDLLTSETSLNKIKSQLNEEREVHERFNTYKNCLSEGKWFTDEIFLIKETLDNYIEKMQIEIEKLNINLETGKKYAIIHKMIKKNFEEISINIVDKAIDANLFSVYVILTSSSLGNLIPWIEELSVKDKNNKDKNIREIHEIERKYGIQLWNNGKPKYHFASYSYASKIGIIDRETSFSQFKEGFFSDLKKILRSKGQEPEWEYLKLGVVVIRINPSKYSFDILDDIENVDTKDLHISRKILELANQYNYLNLPEKATLAIFDGHVDLLEIVNAQSVYDMIDHEGIDYDTYKSFLKSESLKNALLNELNNIGVANFKEVAIGIKDGILTKKELIELFSNVIDEEYFNTYGRQMQQFKRKSIVGDLYSSFSEVSTFWDKK